MGRLWDLVEEYRDGQPYPPSVRAMATKAGMHNSTLSNWQDNLRELPERKHMEAVARLIGRPYEVVLDAALLDAGYVGKPVERPTSRRKEA